MVVKFYKSEEIWKRRENQCCKRKQTALSFQERRIMFTPFEKSKQSEPKMQPNNKKCFGGEWNIGKL